MKFVAAPLVALFVVLAAALPAQAGALAVNQLQDWAGTDGARQVFTYDDLTLTLDVGGDDDQRVGTLTIEKPGAEPVTLSGVGSGGGYGQLGVAMLDEGGGRSVVLAVYAGGAHCCMQTSVATEISTGWVTDAVGSFDGDNVQPEDVDGDGVYEFAMRDDRFNYTFDAYAFSYPPPRILKLRDGKVYDASTEARFKPQFEAMLADAKTSCSGETWELGACAGLLGAAARLGTYEAESEPIFAAVAAGKAGSGWDSYTICMDAECAQTKEIKDFREAVETALKAWGYLPA